MRYAKKKNGNVVLMETPERKREVWNSYVQMGMVLKSI
jgi:hypothetical protein